MKKSIGIFAGLAIIFMAGLVFSAGWRTKTAIQPGSDHNDSVVVVYGDSRSNHVIHQKIIDGILKLKPVAVFHTGDLVFNGKNDQHWSIFNSIVAELVKTCPMYPALGNHELGDLKIQQELQLPNEGKWYSVDVMNIHFVILDVISDYGEGSPQKTWLRQDLADQPDGTAFTAVITHYPFYTSGFHKTDLEKLRMELVPLFRESGVDVVFSGHNHSYERCYADGIYYITTAGGGAPLYNMKAQDPYSQLFVKNYHFCSLTRSGDSLFVTALDTNLVQIDRFYILEKP